MKCPWCGFEAPPRTVHGHLGEVHAREVRLEDSESSRSYTIVCPICGDRYRHPVKPRSSDARFVEEHLREIRLVAFDMLVNHLLAEHEPEPATEEAR